MNPACADDARPAPPLAEDAVHVWLAPWPPAADDAARPAADARWTRGVLARYLGVAPPAVVLARGPYGKPRLAAPAGGAPLEFNLAHSGGLVALAVARHGVGVDVEAIAPLPGLDALAARCLDAAERAAWLAAPAAGRLDAFLRLWTRKEACLKAAGTGLVDHLADAGTIGRIAVPGVRHVHDWRSGGHRFAVASVATCRTLRIEVIDGRAAAVAPA